MFDVYRVRVCYCSTIRNKLSCWACLKWCEDCSKNQNKKAFLQRKMLCSLKSILFSSRSLARAFCGNALKENLYATVINGVRYKEDDWINVTPKILRYPQRQLHLETNHPLYILQNFIVDFFRKRFNTADGQPQFKVNYDLEQMVTTVQNFDSLLIPPDHSIRQRHECFYVNRNQLLRSHLAAHYADCLATGERNFLIVGDVYRRDCIDPLHHSVFHQVDGVRTVGRDQPGGSVQDLEEELKTVWDELLQQLFGKSMDYRWTEGKSPVTSPSWQLELQYNDQHVKVMRSGIIQNEILAQNSIGWNFSVGLERLAIVLFNIPDIRILSTNKHNLIDLIKAKKKIQEMKFKPFVESFAKKHDVSFWLDEGVKHDKFCLQDFYDLVRTVGNNNVERVKNTE